MRKRPNGEVRNWEIKKPAMIELFRDILFKNT